MTKDIPIRVKYRIVKLNGKLTRDKNKFKFTASPFSDCPILEMTDRSKWRLVETVYKSIANTE